MYIYIHITNIDIIHVMAGEEKDMHLYHAHIIIIEQRKETTICKYTSIYVCTIAYYTRVCWCTDTFTKLMFSFIHKSTSASIYRRRNRQIAIADVRSSILKNHYSGINYIRRDEVKILELCYMCNSIISHYPVLSKRERSETHWRDTFEDTNLARIGLEITRGHKARFTYVHTTESRQRQ